MCDKVIIENGGMLMFTSDCYKDNNCYCCLCNKAVDDYAHVLGSVPDCYKIQKMCNKAASTFPFIIKFAPDRFKAKKYVIKLPILVHLFLILFLNKIVSKDPFLC